jgi:hypothetical protein
MAAWIRVWIAPKAPGTAGDHCTKQQQQQQQQQQLAPELEPKPKPLPVAPPAPLQQQVAAGRRNTAVRKRRVGTQRVLHSLGTQYANSSFSVGVAAVATEVYAVCARRTERPDVHVTEALGGAAEGTATVALAATIPPPPPPGINVRALSVYTNPPHKKKLERSATASAAVAVRAHGMCGRPPPPPPPPHPPRPTPHRP